MDIQLPQIFFQLVNFSVVVGGITYLLYKPVQRVLDERADRVEEAARAAEETVSEKEKLAQLKLKAQRDAKREAGELLDEARKEAVRVREEMIARARQEAQADVQKAKAEWQTEKQRMLSKLNDELVDAVIAVSGKLLSEKLDAKKDAALINRELESVLKHI